MDIQPINIRCQLDSPLPSVYIPHELIAEILSFLRVKTITRFRCVSKSWNTLISDPTFIKTHLKNSSQDPHFLLTPVPRYPMCGVESLHISPLLENPPFKVAGGTYDIIKDGNCQVVGSCNGLICLLFSDYISRRQTKYSFCLWNPATRTISEEFGGFIYWPSLCFSNFNFGCDYLTGTYKVLTLHAKSSKVSVLSFGDDRWRDIQNFPLVPLRWNNGVHLSETVNWLAIRGYYHSFDGEVSKVYIPHVEQFVIVSLDLSTETYTQFSLPKGFNEVPFLVPSLQVLMDFFCFSHDFKGTEFVIWKMKEFGVQESWTQLFRIEYVNLKLPNLSVKDCFVGLMECFTALLPRCVSKNGDALVLTNGEGRKVIIYNRRDKRVDRFKFSSRATCMIFAGDYTESLVSTNWKSGDIKEGKDEEDRYLISEEEDPLRDIALGIDGWDLFF